MSYRHVFCLINILDSYNKFMNNSLIVNIKANSHIIKLVDVDMNCN